MALVAEPLCSLVVVWYFKEKAVYSLTRASRIAPDRCWELNEGWIDDWGSGRFSCMSNLPMWMVLYLISKMFSGPSTLHGDISQAQLKNCVKLIHYELLSRIFYGNLLCTPFAKKSLLYYFIYCLCQHLLAVF